MTGPKWAPKGLSGNHPWASLFCCHKDKVHLPSSTCFPLREVGREMNLEVCSFSSCSVFLFLFLNYSMGFSTFLPVFLCCKGDVSPQPVKGRRASKGRRGKAALSWSRHEATSLF